MPSIRQFFGIVVRKYYDEHAPPHFHAYYKKQAAVIAIETLQVHEGHQPLNPIPRLE